MSKIVRYGGNLKAFASEQQTNERTLFGQVTIANDLTSQVTAQFLRGWGIVGPSDQPSLQDFNAAMYTHGQLLAYLHQMGVAEYNAAQEYFIGSVTQTGGVLYMSLTDANIGNTPSSSPANWKAFTADQATEVTLGLVKIATQALTNAGADDASAVTSKKLAVATQGQKHTAFTTTGTATAQVLTPVPAITAYAASQRFNVTFNVASGANPTINVSALGVKNLKQYDSTGAKVAASFALGQNSDVVYDGVDWVLIDPLPSLGNMVGSIGARSNLKGGATGSNAVSTITADELVLESPTGSFLTVRNVNLAPSFANPNGANGLDTGTVQANTFYDRWVISNGVTVAGLLVATPNAPTMPAGYTFKARVGTLRTGATASVPLPFIQFGNQITYVPKPGTNLTAPPVIASGVVAFPSTVGWGGYAPPSASKLHVLITHAQAAAGWVSNSVDYFNQYTQSVSGNSSQFTVPVVPLSGSIYWGSSAGTMGTPTLALMGWEENL